MLDAIHAKCDEVYAIAREHRAEKPWVFGFVVRKESGPGSDVDLVAACPRPVGQMR